MRSIRDVFHGLVIICVPVIIVLLAIRLLLTPLFIQVEYRLPGFPEDNYGFSMKDRLYWANISRLYLINNEEINFLEDQNLPDGIPLYNQRELRHMLDVKNVLNKAMGVLLWTSIFMAGLGIWDYRTGRWMDFKRFTATGGRLTVTILFSLIIYMALNFRSLFTTFHRIFFEGDTWLFNYSDTLIRLFPIQFWRDAFIWIICISLLIGLYLGFFLSRKRRVSSEI